MPKKGKFTESFMKEATGKDIENAHTAPMRAQPEPPTTPGLALAAAGCEAPAAEGFKVRVDPNNYRQHPDNNKRLIKRSLRENGAGRSIVVDNTGASIGGSGVLEQAEALGLKQRIVETDGSELVVVVRKDISPDDPRRKQLALADNATTDQSVWDIAALQANFTTDELASWDIELPQVDGVANDIADGAKDEARAKLADKFLVPPFSVLDTRQGYWQERKQEWLQLTGNLTESKEHVLGGAENMLSQINEGSSNFDPVLAEICMRWFCLPDGRILDPFGGEQTKGVVAGALGYDYTAVEFRPEQVAINKAACAEYPHVHYYCGDSNDISKIVPHSGYDLCFTSPPYYDLEVYSKDDMSALGTYAEFMEQYRNIFAQCVELLADNRFLVIKIGEIRDKKSGVYRNFVGDNIRLFMDLGLQYYNELALVNMCGTAPQRAAKSFTHRKMVKIHQNVLCFFKGDPQTIKDIYPQIEIDNGCFENN